MSGPLWLNVATNGVLSGAPAASDIGTNLFVVSLTDTNGLSATANLTIAVIADPTPTFIENPFAEPSASVGVIYSANIATNATDAELSQGDVLAFAKVGGLAWLGVAANGTLFGTPGIADAGTNIFIVSVTNLGGASNSATMLILVAGGGPAFINNPFAEPPAAAGQLYAANLATNASDANIGAVLITFSEVSGPGFG